MREPRALSRRVVVAPALALVLFAASGAGPAEAPILKLYAGGMPAGCTASRSSARCRRQPDQQPGGGSSACTG